MMYTDNMMYTYNMMYTDDYKYNYLTCENYVMNTYLYLAFSICYVYLATEMLRN